MTAIGFVQRKGDTFTGHLKTLLSPQVPISIDRNKEKKPNSKQPDFRIMSGKIEVGAAWERKSKKDTTYVTGTVAAPEFGPKKLWFTLGRAAGQDDPDALAMIWNARD